MQCVFHTLLHSVILVSFLRLYIFTTFSPSVFKLDNKDSITKYAVYNWILNTENFFFLLTLQPIVGLYFAALYRALASSLTMFLDHTQRRATVGRTPLDEWSFRRRDLYLTTQNTHNRQTSMPPGGIRTHDHSRRAAIDLRLRPRGYWDRQIQRINWSKFLEQWLSGETNISTASQEIPGILWNSVQYLFYKRPPLFPMPKPDEYNSHHPFSFPKIHFNIFFTSNRLLVESATEVLSWGYSGWGVAWPPTPV